MQRTSDGGSDANAGAHVALHHLDLELARRCLARDAAALDRFAVRMRCIPRFLVARARQLGADVAREVLEDLTQEVLAVIWRKLEVYRGDAALETWTYRFCELELRNALRKRAVRAAAVATVDPGQLAERAASPAGDTPGDGERMRLLLDALAPAEAVVVRLKHFEGLTFEEIAARLRGSANTAKTRYYRALDRMRGLLRAAGDDPGGRP